MSDSSENASQISLEARIEALLFVAAGPVSAEQLAAVLEHSLDETQTALRRLGEYCAQDRGLNLQWHNGKVQLTTAPALAPVVEKFLGLEATARLSRAALETLAIIAYRQPVTRPGIDSIRGVNSDGVLKSLLGKGLIVEVGRAEGPGRPILFGTTADFLQQFGISSLDDLPPYELLDDDLQPTNHPILKE